MDKHRNPDGTYDGVGVMSEVSGLGRAEVASIWQEVKANHALLDACPRHDFPEPSAGERQVTCRRCGGHLTSVHARWYRLGLLHGATSE